MAVYNVHERELPAGGNEVGSLVDSLASGKDDQLWPRHQWPPMTFDKPLGIGAVGGHGPIRYTVTARVPGTWIRFTFNAPRGFHGFHEFTVHPLDSDRTVLRHTLVMNTRGPARLTWPLIFRRLHDACVEDSLDRAELACAESITTPARHSRYVRLLRRVLR